MYKILENLATDGLGEPTELSSYVDCEIGLIDDFRIIDVRVLPEFDTPSSPSEHKLNIVRVTSYLELGDKVVVCCSHGMNRSNAIALGVLVQYFKMDFFKALELIKSRVPICTIIAANIVALMYEYWIIIAIQIRQNVIKLPKTLRNIISNCSSF